jgi:Arc/MetJ family transcription regulator
LFLAHHYLITNQFERCRLMCETGIRMSASDTAKSQLEEWRAIAQAELGYSQESVRAAFEAAVRLDPSNDLAKRNQAAFEASLRLPQVPTHSKWDKKTAAAMRDFGLPDRRKLLAA